MWFWIEIKKPFRRTIHIAFSNFRFKMTLYTTKKYIIDESYRKLLKVNLWSRACYTWISDLVWAIGKPLLDWHCQGIWAANKSTLHRQWWLIPNIEPWAWSTTSKSDSADRPAENSMADWSPLFSARSHFAVLNKKTVMFLSTQHCQESFSKQTAWRLSFSQQLTTDEYTLIADCLFF